MKYTSKSFTLPASGKGTTQKEWDRAFLTAEEFRVKYAFDESVAKNSDLLQRLAGKQGEGELMPSVKVWFCCSDPKCPTSPQWMWLAYKQVSEEKSGKSAR